MRIFIALIAILVATVISPAHAQTLYGATGGNTASNLYTINTTTGAATSIGPIGFAVTGLALHPTTGVMYGVTTPLSPGCASCLITVNLTTGAGTTIGALGQIIAELAFRADGTLFGWSETVDNLATINLATGAATIVGASGTGTSGDGMAFVGGVLVAFLSGASGNVWTVDTTTGLATIGPVLTGSPVGGASVSAASLNPASGILFASLQGAPGTIVTINTATGVITNIGATVNGIDALEFGPLALGGSGATPVPTLSEWMLGLLALAMVAVAMQQGIRPRRT